MAKKLPKFMEKKLKKEVEEDQEMVEEIEEPLNEEEEKDTSDIEDNEVDDQLFQQREYLLNEGNYRTEIIAQFTLLRTELSSLNENLTKVGKVMEDVLEAVSPEEDE